MVQLTTTSPACSNEPAGPGWRQGRPAEDPEKMKRWGFVSAKPSEYLVHVRGGRVLAKSSGQGAVCFKWPWDTVAVVPTSLQRLSFRADQVTAERVGVEVVGLAVYRIAEPLLAYRVLNFSYPERAQQKLEETLTSMFVGAARRLIANLTVQDCLQKRKNAIAQELLREIAPVVGGSGRPDDMTVQGWGVVLDTIEIQEVRVLSGSVFQSMQAPFRAELERQAREARAMAEQQVTTREAMCRRETEEATIAADEAIRERRAQVARRVAELEAEQERARVETSRALQEARMEADTQVTARSVEAELVKEEARAKAARRRLEIELEESEAERAALESRLGVREARAAIARVDASCTAEIEAVTVQSELARGHAHAAIELELAQVDKVRAEAHARRVLAERLPDLAGALGQRIGEVRITQLGIGGNPFESILQAIAAVVEVARTA